MVWKEGCASCYEGELLGSLQGSPSLRYEAELGSLRYMTQLGTHMAFPAYYVEDWEAVTQGTGLLPDPASPPSPMHCDLQRFPKDHTLANTLWLTQLSSLLTPRVTGCHIMSLHRGILSLLRGILNPSETLPLRPLHLLESSEV